MQPSGPCPAKVMVVGEAPGEWEARQGRPFVGPSGAELDRMLHEAGLLRSQCFVTNVCSERPPGNDVSLWVKHTKGRPKEPGDWSLVQGKWLTSPVVSGLDRLQKEIALCNPEVIIPLGNLALWALTGKWGITDWRGSIFDVEGRTVIPTYHPAAVLRQYDWRFITVHDLRRAASALKQKPESPAYNFLLRPSLDDTLRCLGNLQKIVENTPLEISVDIETRWGHIACIGLAWTEADSICIPFMCIERRDGYWLPEEEALIVHSLYRLLTHRNCRVIGQNFLYDTQYIYRHWHFIPNFSFDTMLGHHVCFPGLPKGLDFLSSLYCRFHLFWKAESKEWHQTMAEDILWAYNCKDCVITLECARAIRETISKLGLEAPATRQMKLFWSALRAMIRGVRVDAARRARLQVELNEALREREAWFEQVLGHSLNIRSPLQMKKLFYDDLGQKPVLHRKTRQPTLDDDALDKIQSREPLLRPLIEKIRECRSIGVFLSTFVNAQPDVDGRMRSSFNPAGTETFRFNSSMNAFGSGMNLQNIPKGDEE